MQKEKVDLQNENNTRTACIPHYRFLCLWRRESLYTYTRKLEGMKEDIRAYDEKNDKTKVEVCSAEGRQERKM